MFYTSIQLIFEKEVIINHIYYDGTSQYYSTWTWHCKVKKTTIASYRDEVYVDIGDQPEDMICDIGIDFYKIPCI